MRYFPGCDLLSAPEKRGASYVWKSIYSSLGYLRRGTFLDVSSNTLAESSSGAFSVKSAYTFIEAESSLANTLAESSSCNATEPFWKYIWKLDIPRKIKLFIWRAYNNGLPTGSELMRKLGFINARCCFCNYRIESPVHLFKDCWWVRALWTALNLDESHLHYQFLNFADWIFYLSTILPVKEFRLVTVTFWYTWFNRNLRWHDGRIMDIHEAKEIFLFFIKRCSNAHTVYNSHFQNESLIWPPPNEFIKVNCDGAWNSIHSLTGIGVICTVQ